MLVLVVERILYDLVVVYAFQPAPIVSGESVLCCGALLLSIIPSRESLVIRSCTVS